MKLDLLGEIADLYKESLREAASKKDPRQVGEYHAHGRADSAAHYRSEHCKGKTRVWRVQPGWFPVQRWAST